MWRQNNTTALSSYSGGLGNILLTRDRPEGFNPNLLLCNEQPGPECQVLDLEYLPYYRTSHICVCPAPHICTESEESSNEGKADTKQDKQVSYSATPQDIFHAVGHLKSFLASHSYRLHIWLNWVKYLQGELTLNVSKRGRKGIREAGPSDIKVSLKISPLGAKWWLVLWKHKAGAELSARMRHSSPCKVPLPWNSLWTQTAAVGDIAGSGWDLSPCCASKGSAVPNAPSSDTSALGPVRGFFQSILPSLELSKRTISPPSKEEPQELLGASSSALCLPMPSFPSGLPALNQPPPCTGYFPYYRTEAGICTGPLERTESFTRIEILEIKEGGQRAGSSVWSLRGSCLVSWEERRDFVDADVKEKLLKPMTIWKSAWIWIKWKYSFSQKNPKTPTSDIPDCVMEAERSRAGAWEIQ